jgi:Flp pilus assembly protein TadD
MVSSRSLARDLCRRGLSHHQAGRLQQAELAYRQALGLDPAHADALHLLGVVARQKGRNEEAVDRIGQAIAVRPEPHFYCSLGFALTALGRFDEAEASYRNALRLRPGFAEAGRNLGGLLNRLGRWAEAATILETAVRSEPGNHAAYNDLGMALQALGRLQEAEAAYRALLRFAPKTPATLCNLGYLLTLCGRFGEAEEALQAAIGLMPNLPDAHGNLGNLLVQQGRYAEAEASLRTALRLRPAYPEALNNLGIALAAQGQPLDAVASYREALRLRPDLAPAHLNLGFALLTSGQLAEGWEEHEWRWTGSHLAGLARNFSGPLWNGEAIGGRPILLHAEQGMGDTIQFCRYVPMMAAGTRVVFEVQPPLVRLLGQLRAQIVVQGDPLPPFDLHCPLLSLPRAFGTTLETIPAAIPYLAADPVLAAAWRERLAGLAGLRVGVVWAGAPNLGDPQLAAASRRRSIDLAMLAPLAVPGVSLVSLQKDAPPAAPPPGLALFDASADLRDFADTAALVAALDLVIGVDTAVIHLAGAMGKPVWLLNRFDTDWRWLLERDDSPWYPTLRQFRQPAPGDWTSVVRDAANALQRLAAGDRSELLPKKRASSRA